MYPRAVSSDIRSYRAHAAEETVARSFEGQSKGNERVPSRHKVHLTRRQLEVLTLLCDGLPNKLISRRLKISAATVKVHISVILKELGVSNRLQAIIAARRQRFVVEASVDGSTQSRHSGAVDPCAFCKFRPGSAHADSSRNPQRRQR